MNYRQETEQVSCDRLHTVCLTLLPLTFAVLWGDYYHSNFLLKDCCVMNCYLCFTECLCQQLTVYLNSVYQSILRIVCSVTDTAFCVQLPCSVCSVNSLLPASACSSLFHKSLIRSTGSHSDKGFNGLPSGQLHRLTVKQQKISLSCSAGSLQLISLQLDEADSSDLISLHCVRSSTPQLSDDDTVFIWSQVFFHTAVSDSSLSESLGCSEPHMSDAAENEKIYCAAACLVCNSWSAQAADYECYERCLTTWVCVCVSCSFLQCCIVEELHTDCVQTLHRDFIIVHCQGSTFAAQAVCFFCRQLQAFCCQSWLHSCAQLWLFWHITWTVLHLNTVIRAEMVQLLSSLNLHAMKVKLILLQHVYWQWLRKAGPLFSLSACNGVWLLHQWMNCLEAHCSRHL